MDRSIYTGPIGKRYRVSCPKLCKEVEASVIGHEAYHYSSSICLAAIH